MRGLAWTSVGGDTLSIEVNVMPGKGKMELTGCMGDVMKESAQIGLSYVRSIAENYGIDSGYFEKHDMTFDQYYCTTIERTSDTIELATGQT